MKTNESNNYQHIKALNKAYLKKQLVIFYGAGISKPLGLPSWSELISGVLNSFIDIETEEGEIQKDKLLKTIEGKSYWDSINYLKKALGIEDEKFKNSVAEEIEEKEDLNCPNGGEWPDNNYWDMAKMDIPLFMTTNYDTIFSKVLNGKCQHVDFLKSEKALSEYLGSNSVNNKEIIYLHGCVDRPSSIVISGDDVKKMYESDRWKTGLSSVLTSHKVLFLGVSFDDEYLMQFLKEVKTVAGNPIYSFSIGESDKKDFPHEEIFIHKENIVQEIREVMSRIRRKISEIILLRFNITKCDEKVKRKIRTEIRKRFTVFESVEISIENGYLIVGFGNCREKDEEIDIDRKLQSLVKTLRKEKILKNERFVCYISQNTENYSLTRGTLNTVFKKNQYYFMTQMIDSSSSGIVIDKIGLNLNENEYVRKIRNFTEKKGRITNEGKEYTVYVDEKVTIKDSENSGVEVHVAGLIFYEGKLLLEKRSENEAIAPNKLSLPGGRLRPGEGFRDGLERILKQKYSMEVGTMEIADEFKTHGANIPGIAFLTDTKLIDTDRFTFFDQKAIDDIKDADLGCERKLLNKAFKLSRTKVKDSIKLRIIMLTECVYNCRCCHHENLKDIHLKSREDQIIHSLLFLHQNFDITQITITGGEPLLPGNRACLLNVLKVIREEINNIDLSIITNGYYLDEDCIEELKKYNIRYKISLYGYDNESFFQYARVNKEKFSDFDYIQDFQTKLNLLYKNKCVVTINIPLQKYIFQGLETLFKQEEFRSIIEKAEIKIKIIDMVKPRINPELYEEDYIEVNSVDQINLEEGETGKEDAEEKEREKGHEWNSNMGTFSDLPVELYQYPCKNLSNCSECFNNFALTMKPDGTFLICRRALNEKNRKIFQQYKIEVEDVDLGQEYGKREEE